MPSTPRSNPRENPITALFEAFRKCRDRKREFDKNGFAKPHVDDVPMDAGIYANAVDCLDIESTLVPGIIDFRQRVVQLLRDADPKEIAETFKSGQSYLVAYLPDLTKDKIELKGSFNFFPFTAEGLLSGVAGEPSFFFRIVPREIQRRCSVHVPVYEKEKLPNPGEIDELIYRVELAIDNFIDTYRSYL